MSTTAYSPNFTFKYGPEENLDNLDYQTGAIIFCTDGQQFVDVAGSRHRISNIIADYTETQIHSVDGKFIPVPDPEPEPEPEEPIPDTPEEPGTDIPDDDNTDKDNTPEDSDNTEDNGDNNEENNTEETTDDPSETPVIDDPEEEPVEDNSNEQSSEDTEEENNKEDETEESGTLLGAGDTPEDPENETPTDSVENNDDTDPTDEEDPSEETPEEPTEDPEEPSDDEPTGDDSSDEPVEPSDDPVDPEPEEQPAFTPHGLPVIYIASDTHRAFIYNTETYMMEEFTVKLAIAATNDGEGNNIAETYCTKLTEEANYTSATDRIAILEEQVAALPKFIIRVCDEELPDVGEEGVIYFVPVESSGDEPVYASYIWVESEEYYIKIGSSSADLENYPTREEMTRALNSLRINLDANITEGDARLQNSIDDLSARVISAETTVARVDRSVSTYDSRINAVVEKANTNESNIASLNTALMEEVNTTRAIKTDVDNNTTDISTLSTSTRTNTLDIEGLTTRMGTAERNIRQLAETSAGSGETFNIINNRLDELENTTGTLSTQCNDNSIDIAEIKEINATQTSDIATNAAGIRSNSSAILTHGQKITNIESDITDLKVSAAQTATNTANITAINAALDTKLTYVSGELSNVDFNNYKTAGCFDVTDVSEATHCPSTSAGTLYIIASPYCCVQQFITKDTMYVRSFTDNDWTAWTAVQSWEISSGKFVEDFGFDG